MAGEVRRQVAAMLRRGRGEPGAVVETAEAEVRTSEPRPGRGRRGPVRKRERKSSEDD